MASNKEVIAMQNVLVGEVLYTKVYLDIQDIVNVKSKSGSVKKTLQGHVAKRQTLVLEKPTPTTATVTYLTTFGGEDTKLPDTIIDKTLWYPITPAQAESIYEPGEVIKDGGYEIDAQWASLRQKQIIAESSVERLVGYTAKPETVVAILNAMMA